MRTIYSTRLIDVPEGVNVSFKARQITVSGPKGSLTRAFKHIDVDIQFVNEKKQIKVDLWFGNRKTIATIRTICSHIENMITGVTKGFKYKMRFCYAHFPINVSATKDSTGKRDVVEIRNFLGEKKVRKIELMDGVKYTRTADVKDQIEISGIDITKVSLSCAQIAQSTAVKHKDIRKFLDGIYVSERSNIDA